MDADQVPHPTYMHTDRRIRFLFKWQTETVSHLYYSGPASVKYIVEKKIIRRSLFLLFPCSRPCSVHFTKQIFNKAINHPLFRVLQ